MNLLEEKREHNNLLFRVYHSHKNKKFLYELLNYNYDLISYTILKYYPNLKYRKDAYEIGIVAIINAIENYEMDMMSGFEEYMVAYIKDALNKYLNSDKVAFVCNIDKESLNIGDVWYNINHTLEDTIDTKKIRDNVVIKQYKKFLKDK